MGCFCQFRLASAAVFILILFGVGAGAQGHREFPNAASIAQVASAEVQKDEVPDLQLAATANHHAMPGRNSEDAVVLTVTRDGRLFLRDDPASRVELSGLASIVRDRLVNRLAKMVYVNADARARYHVIEQVLRQLPDAKVDMVDLLTTPRGSFSNSEVAPAGLEVIIPLRAPRVVPARTGTSGPIIVQVLQGPSGVGWKLNRQSVTDVKDLTTRLSNILHRRADRVVFLKGNGALAFGDVIDAIDAIYGSGADRVAVVTADIELKAPTRRP